MKPILLFISLAALFFAGCQSPSMDAAASRIDLQFQNPENFTDLKNDLTNGDIGRQKMQELFRQMVIEEAGPRVKEGQKLKLVFTDIDLAGDYLPSASTTHDFRVIREVYPPRQRFNYTLTDASGAVLKEGEAKLSDLSFQMNVNPVNRQDELFYDRELFRDWVRQNLR